jgi:hypothetical protein
MRTRPTDRLGLLAFPLLSLACVSSEVRLTTLRQPQKPDGCEVAVFSKTKPPYPVEDLAVDRASCLISRNHCVERLRADACLVGADTVYGFEEVEEPMQTIIQGTLSRRSGPAAPAVPGPPALAPDPRTPTFSR